MTSHSRWRRLKPSIPETPAVVVARATLRASALMAYKLGKVAWDEAHTAEGLRLLVARFSGETDANGPTVDQMKHTANALNEIITQSRPSEAK